MHGVRALPDEDEEGRGQHADDQQDGDRNHLRVATFY